MTRFEKFLQDNNLKKQDVAEYLGKSASSMSYYCKEGNELSEAMIDKLAEKWDVSAFRSAPVRKVAKEDTIQFYIGEVALLRQIVENQSAIIARYEALLHTSTRELARKMDEHEKAIDKFLKMAEEAAEPEPDFEEGIGVWKQEK